MTNVFYDPIGFYKTGQVCAILMVTRQTLVRYRKFRGFPDPTVFVEGGENRYYIPHVHAWIRDNLAFVARAALAGRNIRARLVKRRRANQPDQRDLFHPSPEAQTASNIA